MDINKIAYFDNAATTLIKPEIVYAAIKRYSQNSISIGRSNRQFSSGLIPETRKLLCELFNASMKYAAVFSATATDAINTILQGEIKKNQNIYISPFEHNAIYRVLKMLEKKYKINIYQMDIDKRTLEFKLDSIRQQFNVNRPSIIIVSHVSNVCGNIAPIEELGNIASSYNAKFIIDCAQSAGLLDIDIQKNKADYIIFAGHKTLYSSFGCSGFICRKDTSLQPLIVGGTGSESASEVMPKQIPDRFEAGTKNTIAIASLNASLKWIKEVGLENLYNKERESYVKLYELLRNYDFIRIVGKGKNTTSIISCSFVGLAPDNIANILGEHNIVIRAGLQCSPLAHKFLNTYPEGTVRFSVSYFTSEENLLKLKKVLEIIDEGI